MNRERIYMLQKGEGKTFDHDNNLPPLPLPKLEDTLERYYESLKPFGTPAELSISRRIIDEFKNGIGRQLHEIVEKRTWTEKNWVDKWWEDYGYFLLRFPLHPYTVMACPLPLEKVGVPESEAYCLKAGARAIHHTIEFWYLLYHEKMRPAISPDGSTHYSMTLYRRFYCASRIPGDPLDKIEAHFRTFLEGNGPTHGIVMAKGRIFKFDCLNADGSVITPAHILRILQIIRGAIESDVNGDCAPVLTCDDRSSWAKNRSYLEELSVNNKNLLKIVESSVVVACLDEHSPKDYSEVCEQAVTGDFHSKWADRSSTITLYRNGRVSCVGEHSAYDGTCSVSFAFFVLLSLLEVGEPDWNDLPSTITPPIELNFDLDETLKIEIQRVLNDCEARRNEVSVLYETFTDYGKNFLKEKKLHPDAFIQMVMQLAYYKMHQEIAATYETALMRQYYNGRTETLRSCSTDTTKFLKVATNPKSSNKEIVDALKNAVSAHNNLMLEARKGNGIDRHLFGLWCAAYEQNIDIPELYSDPLYSRSGGGGNFTLSTSTLGYTAVNGFVAPMTMEGYGFFYSVASDEINVSVAAYRASPKTSALKLSVVFCDTLKQMKSIIEDVTAAKL